MLFVVVARSVSLMVYWLYAFGRLNYVSLLRREHWSKLSSFLVVYVASLSLNSRRLSTLQNIRKTAAAMGVAGNSMQCREVIVYGAVAVFFTLLLLSGHYWFKAHVGALFVLK